MCLWAPLSAAASAEPVNAADVLKHRHDSLREQLLHNQFQQPLYLESVESSGHLQGDIYAVMDQPFAVVGKAFDHPANWCDVLILHPNVKYCRASSTATGATLAVDMGTQRESRRDQSFHVGFAYRVAVSTPNYLRVELGAASGPLQTRNYQIMLEVVAVNARTSFLHFNYSYDYGLTGSIAMTTYLATRGRSKVGFTIVSRQPGGEPNYLSGVRGVVERNTMRYYLAIDAYLSTLAAPLPAQLEQRLQFWYAAAERYPRQLHDLDRDTYLTMKRSEYQRQQAQPVMTGDNPDRASSGTME